MAETIWHQDGRWEIREAKDGHIYVRNVMTGLEDHPVRHIYPDGAEDIQWENADAIPTRIRLAFREVLRKFFG